MTFAEWMVPQLSVSAALELENSKRTIRSHAKSHPDQIIDLACSAMEQAFLHQAIVRQATKHIAELEMTLLLASPAASEPAPPGPAPWHLRLLLRLYGYRVESGSAP